MEELGGNAWGRWWDALKAKVSGLSVPALVIELTPCLESVGPHIFFKFTKDR